MLPVFSVILAYRMDGRNSSDRHCALQPFESKPKHIHLYSVEPYQLHLITKHAFRRTDAKLMQGDGNNVFRGF